MSEPVYLVSRCSSIDEFVAAFRRYVDRLGVFVPVIQPVAVGRKGRFAITLKDGRILIDGEAEIIMSSSRASGLHGRPGMTLRFSKVDDDSKVVLEHLEKVRFSAKLTSSAPHLVARPGPAVVDPGPPAPIKPGSDPAQQLAECIVLGDSGERSRSNSAPPPGGGKYPIPPLTMRPASGSTPPPYKPGAGAASGGVVAVPASSVGSGAVSGPSSAPASGALSGPVTAPVAVPPPSPTPSVGPSGASGTLHPHSVSRPIGTHRPTMMGPAVMPERLPTSPLMVTGASAAVARDGSGPVNAVPAMASVSGAVTMAGGAATVPNLAPIGTPPGAATEPMMTAPAVIEDIYPGVGGLDALPPNAVPLPQPFLRHTTRGVAPPTLGDGEVQFSPVNDALPTTDMPVLAKPAAPAPPILPEAPSVARSRTMMGLPSIGRAPAPPSSPGIAALPAVASGPVVVEPVGITGPSVEIDPSLLESTDIKPIDELGMEPTAESAPIIDPHVAVTVQAPQLGGPPVLATPAPGTLMVQPMIPGQPMPMPGMPPWPGGPLPHPGVGYPPEAPRATRALTDGGTGFFDDTGARPRVGYDSSTNFVPEGPQAGRVGYVSEDMTSLVQAPPSKKRLLVIVISCLAVFVIGFIVLLAVGDGDKPSNKLPPTTPAIAPPPTTPAPVPVPVPTTGSAAVAVTAGSGTGSATGSAGSATGSATGSSASTPSVQPDGPDQPEDPDEPTTAGSGSGSGSATGSGARVAVAPTPPATAGCALKVTSNPSGSEVMIAGKNRGKTPLELAVPCAQTQVAVRRSRYATWTRTVKPTAKVIKLNARLERPTFTVKVSSVPSGATVSVGGKKQGKTPTAVKVPGYDPTTITLTKDGYASASEKVTAKQSGTAIKMTLKKK